MKHNGEETFFMISRVNSHTEMVEYFVGFVNEYDKETSIEKIGNEVWSELSIEGKRFETFTEANEWMKVLDWDDEDCISLYRLATPNDHVEREDDCDDCIALKIFRAREEVR